MSVWQALKVSLSHHVPILYKRVLTFTKHGKQMAKPSPSPPCLPSLFLQSPPHSSLTLPSHSHPHAPQSQGRGAGGCGSQRGCRSLKSQHSQSPVANIRRVLLGRCGHDVGWMGNKRGELRFVGAIESHTAAPASFVAVSRICNSDFADK